MSKLYREKPITLYHYSVEKYDSLKSLSARELQKEGFVSNEQDPFAYNKSISFFFEPIPLDLPEILNNEHNFWKSGTRLYQYEISTSQLEEDVPYLLTESEEIIDTLYNKQDWSKAKGQPEIVKQYKAELKELETRLRYKGTGVDNLIRVAKKYRTGIREKYKALYQLHLKNPEDGLLDKYAACVPHVMIYVDKQVLKPQRVQRIRLK